jgi:hypothetical protein
VLRQRLRNLRRDRLRVHPLAGVEHQQTIAIGEARILLRVGLHPRKQISLTPIVAELFIDRAQLTLERFLCAT